MRKSMELAKKIMRGTGSSSLIWWRALRYKYMNDRESRSRGKREREGDSIKDFDFDDIRVLHGRGRRGETDSEYTTEKRRCAPSKTNTST